MKLLLLLATLLPSCYSTTPSLRHEDSVEERLLKRIKALESAVDFLSSELASQQRLLADSCSPYLSSINNATWCVFDQPMAFVAPTGFYNETSLHEKATFNAEAVFESDVTLNDDVEFSALSKAKFLGDATFEGPDESVKFDTEVLFKKHVLFEDEVEFEDPVVFTNDVTVEGPGARRTRRRMSSHTSSSRSSDSDDDEVKFKVEGRVEVELDTDRDLIVETETYFEEDVHVGEDRRRNRQLGSRRSSDPKLIVEGELTAMSGVHVEGILEADDHAVFHQDLVFDDWDCLVDCSATGHDEC